MDNRGFWIKKYFKDHWAWLLCGFLFVAVFGYFALGKAMDIAEPKVILICSIIFYIIYEIYHLLKYLTHHTE